MKKSEETKMRKIRSREKVARIVNNDNSQTQEHSAFAQVSH